MADGIKPMFINGKWVLAEGGATFDVRNPADQSVVAAVANGASPEIEQAVVAAAAAFPEWSALARRIAAAFSWRSRISWRSAATSWPGW